MSGFRNYLKTSCFSGELPFDKLRANVTSSDLMGTAFPCVQLEIVSQAVRP